MGFSTAASLRSLELFGIIHTNLSRLPSHTNAGTALRGFTVTWQNPPGAFGVLAEGFGDGFWMGFGAGLVLKWCRGIVVWEEIGEGETAT